MPGPRHRVPGWLIGSLAAAAIAGVAPQAVAGPPPEDCEQLVKDDSSARGSYACFYSRARTTGEYDLAIERVEALTVAHADVPWVWMTLGNLLEDQAKDGADEALEKGISLMAETVEPRAEVFARINYANGLRHRGRAEEARVQLEAAKERAGDDEVLSPIADLEWARFLVFTGGDHQEADRILLRVRPALFPDGPYQARVVWLHTAEVLYRRLDRLDKAVEVVDELEELARDAGDRYVETNTALNGALLYSLVIKRQSKPDVDGYRTRLERALALSKRYESLPVRASSVCLLAELAEPAEQLGAARRCVELLREVGEPDVRFAYAGVAAVVLSHAGAGDVEVEQALDLARAAVEDGSDAVAGLDVAVMRMVILGNAGEIDAAAAVAEQAAGEFRSVLGRNEGFVEAAEQTAEWRPAFNAVVAKLADDPRASPDVLARALRLHDAQLGVAWESVMASDFAATDFDEPPRSWRERLQTLLGPDEALLVYGLDEADTPLPASPGGGSRVWVVTRETIEVHALPRRHRIAARVRAWSGALIDAGADEAALAAELGSTLLGSALDSLPPNVDSLILVADADVHQVPFTALRVGANATRLGARFGVQRAPNVRSLMRWRLEPLVRSPGPVHVFAAPDGTKEVRAPLPWAEREAENIAGLYGPSTVVHVRSDATETRLTAEAGGRGLLHVAAHASVSGADPLLSAVHLAADEFEDGDLSVGEIYENRFDGEIVVLSSCDSSAGVVLPGEGVAGLGQAFFNRGARAVVATLWPIRDAEAEAFVGDLYEALARGEALAAALAHARREAIRAGRPAESWAGYVLLGDGRATLPSLVSAEDGDASDRADAERKPSHWRWWSLLGALGAAAVGWIWVKRTGSNHSEPG